MKDNYKKSLEILHRLLKESDNNHWANWITKDLQLWESKKNTKHHLGAYGGMGSINDLYVGSTDNLGIWKNQVFDTIKNLSYNLASKRTTEAPISIDFYKYGTGQMSGWRCIKCGYARLDKNQIDNYLSYHYLPEIITQLIREDALEKLLPIDTWMYKSEINEERVTIFNVLKSTNIKIENNDSWLSKCPNCESKDVCIYRWEYNKKNETIIESKGNLKIGKTKKQEGLNWETKADGELHTSEWFGAIIRYFWHLGKKEFDFFYNTKELKKNALIGWIFKVIMVLIFLYAGYHYMNSI